jgi:hypothetical protein
MREISAPVGREALQMGKDRQPQVGQRALPDPLDQECLRGCRDPDDERRDHEPEHDERKLVQVVGEDPIVDRELRE